MSVTQKYTSSPFLLAFKHRLSYFDYRSDDLGSNGVPVIANASRAVRL